MWPVPGPHGVWGIPRLRLCDDWGFVRVRSLLRFPGVKFSAQKVSYRWF
jgi:hypothetical protein